MMRFGKPMFATAAAAIAIVCVLAAWMAKTHTVTAVEFYSERLKRYVIVADPSEVAAWDAAGGKMGWVRTGGQFTAYTYPWPGREPVHALIRAEGVGVASRFLCVGENECRSASEDAPWAHDDVAFYVPRPRAGKCPSDTYPVWRSRLSDAKGEINGRLTIDLTVYTRMTHQGFAPGGVVMCAPVSEDEKVADIVRLLEQSTLGPTEALVAEVKATGIEGWLNEQLAMNVTRYTQYSYAERPQNNSFASLCVDDETTPVTPEKYCHTYKIAPQPVGWEFFRQAKTAPDQLRLRMAHVWHQILVMSDGNGTYVYADFHQRLRDNAFGTFENLLLKFALSPQLGEFQNWVRNVPLHDGIRPNENFARELMQLFTIGVNELNDDGTAKLDAHGRLIPTYGQSDIETLARVFTGFDFPPMPGAAAGWGAPNYYVGDMIPYDDHHDMGGKRLLNGLIDLPAGEGAMADVRAAIHALVMHPNTPAFISKQLIQKLVTSSPTTDYVRRVAAVFKDNGKGVRGSLADVTRAVLLDPEARGPRRIDPEYGRLREPVLFWTAMIRALDVTTDGERPYALSGQSGELLFLPPTVFNYYPSDYTLAGSAVSAPEFGIFGSTEFLTRANQVHDLLYNADLSGTDVGAAWGPQPYVVNATGTPSPTLTAFLSDAGDADALVRRLDRLFLHGAMRPAMRDTIVRSVNQIAPENRRRRADLAVELTLTSVDYLIQK
jgi:uncharacterized protein (DUF1800 family)